MPRIRNINAQNRPKKGPKPNLFLLVHLGTIAQLFTKKKSPLHNPFKQYEHDFWFIPFKILYNSRQSPLKLSTSVSLFNHTLIKFSIFMVVCIITCLWKNSICGYAQYLVLLQEKNWIFGIIHCIIYIN